MKSLLILSLCIVLVSILPLVTLAETIPATNCSRDGYTILTINGIFTNETDAKNNAFALKQQVDQTHNGQAVAVDYLYNPTHIGGLGDIFDSIKQGLFDNQDVNDYDLTDMLTDASQNIKTQKVLLVGHSQGNFYANSFYQAVVNRSGGIPAASLGVYAVATPSDHVAGGGRYVTSDTDTVIAGVVGHLPLKNILPPNDHINLKLRDGLGHAFSDVYLKYLSPRIVSDIDWSLDRLSPNTTQGDVASCIDSPRPSMVHAIENILIASADIVAKTTVGNAMTVVTAPGTIIASVGSTAVTLGRTITHIADAVTALGSSVTGTLFQNQQTSINSNLASAAMPAEENAGSTPPDSMPAPAVDDTTTVVDSSSSSAAVDTLPSDVPVHDTSSPTVQTAQDNQLPASSPEPNVETPAVNQNQDATSNSQKDTSIAVLLGGGGGAAVQPPQSWPQQTPPSQDDQHTQQQTSSDQSSQSSQPQDQPTTPVAGDTTLPDTSTTGTTGTTGTASSAAGDTATSTPPVITITGSNIATSPKGTNYLDPGATATDSTGAALSVTAVSTVNPSLPGTYAITYTATDSHGNTTTIIRTVIIQGIKKYFDVDNKIAYTGGYLICNADTHSVLVSGSTAGMTTFVSSSNWQTTRMKDPNSNMPVGVHFHFIFSNDAQATSDCTTDTYLRDYSDTFHYATASGSSVIADNSKIISSFVITNATPTIVGGIVDSSHTIVVAVPSVVDATHLVPHIVIPAGATIAPASDAPEDFTNPVVYTVSAPDGSTQIYTAHVVPQGALLTFDSSNKIMYTGIFLICNVDAHTVRTSGDNAGVINFISSSNWQTAYQATPNVNMQINTNFRFIFGDHAMATSDCLQGTYVDRYSNTFYYSTSSGASVVYGLYNPNVTTQPPADQSQGTNTQPVTPDPTTDASVLPTITGYTLNGMAGNIVSDPTTHPLELAITANKNVNWMSVKIENQDDSSFYKIFQSGPRCVDGTATCTKTWDGILSSGGLLHDGIFRIRVHIKDDAGNEYEQYLSPYVITVDVP